MQIKIGSMQQGSVFGFIFQKELSVSFHPQIDVLIFDYSKAMANNRRVSGNIQHIELPIQIIEALQEIIDKHHELELLQEEKRGVIKNFLKSVSPVKK